MSYKIKWLIILTLFLPCTALAQWLEIDADTKDCIRGLRSMNVEVRVNGEVFEFDPSCGFTFAEDFQTRNGVKCEIQSGMCSSFSMRGKLEVACGDGVKESIRIACPVDDFDLDIHLRNSRACMNSEHGRMEIEVKADFFERHRFSARCSSRLNQTFETKDGDVCRVESDMCTYGDPQAMVEVNCRGGASERESFRCFQR